MSNGGEFRRAGGRKGVGGCVGWGRERVVGRLRGSVGWVGDSGPRDVFRSVDAVGGDGGAIGVACRGGVRGGGWLWEVGLGREGEKSGKGGYSGSKSGDKGGGNSETDIGEKGIVGGAVVGRRGPTKGTHLRGPTSTSTKLPPEKLGTVLWDPENFLP